MKKTIYLAPGAHIIGDVTFGTEVSIWYNAVVRGDTDRIFIGNQTNVQDNCTLHTDTGFPIRIGVGVSIGHNTVIHGCTIGDHTLIGMGSVLLNGARIGKNCIIGAGALVTANTIIPDNSVVLGSPAKIVRQMTDAEIAANKKNAAHYTELMHAALEK